MKTKELIKIITPYCTHITQGGKHIKAYPKESNTVITISSTSSDMNFHKQVFRDFRRTGIIIEKLNY